MTSQTPRIDVGQIRQGRFLAHGELQVWHHERLLCYEASGPFNVEMVDVMSRAVGRVLKGWRPPEVYVVIAWWHGSLLASPAVLAAYRGLLRQGRRVMPAEQASLWLVGPDIEDADIMKPLWQKVHEDCGYRREYCDTEARMLARASELLRAAGVDDHLPHNPQN